MTEKRYIEGVKGFDDYDAWDNETEQGLSHSEVVNELNRLSEENKQLKDILKDITIQLNANHTMSTYQIIVPINRVIYNELNQRLKETSFNEELRVFLDD